MFSIIVGSGRSGRKAYIVTFFQTTISFSRLKVITLIGDQQRPISISISISISIFSTLYLYFPDFFKVWKIAGQI